EPLSSYFRRWRQFAPELHARINRRARDMGNGLDKRPVLRELAVADMKGAFMSKAQPLSVYIARPIAEVYKFLADPANLSSWTFARNGRHEPDAGLLVWSFDGPRGRVLVHFTPPNPFYVLDYKLSEDGHTTQEGYVRLIPAG